MKYLLPICLMCVACTVTPKKTEDNLVEAAHPTTTTEGGSMTDYDLLLYAAPGIIFLGLLGYKVIVEKESNVRQR